jgi:hypothetical protein
MAFAANPTYAALLFNLFLFSRPSRHLVEGGSDVGNVDDTVAFRVVGVAIVTESELYTS